MLDAFVLIDSGKLVGGVRLCHRDVDLVESHDTGTDHVPNNHVVANLVGELAVSG